MAVVFFFLFSINNKVDDCDKLLTIGRIDKDDGIVATVVFLGAENDDEDKDNDKDEGNVDDMSFSLSLCCLFPFIELLTQRTCPQTHLQIRF